MKFNGIPAQHIYYVAVLVFIYRYVFVTLSILAQSILAHMRFGSSARGHGDTATPPRPSHDALDSATMAAAAARLQTVPLALQAAYRDARCARRFEGGLVAAVPGNGGRLWASGLSDDVGFSSGLAQDENGSSKAYATAARAAA